MPAELGSATYESLNSIAYDLILRGLREGKFEQGESLRTRALAKALGVSSTPVREALSRLIAQNALDVTPSNRSAITPTLTHAALEELYEIRLVLDGMAVRAAAASITSDEIKALQALTVELDALEERNGDTSVFLAKSEEFFMRVFTAARRPILFNLLDNLWLRSSVILGLLSKQRPPEFSIGVHRRALVKALAAHDPAAAKAAMDNVLVSTRDMVFKAIADAPEIKAGGKRAPRAKAKKEPAST